MYITFIGHFRNTGKYDPFEKLLHLSSEKQEHHRSFPKTNMCVCVCVCARACHFVVYHNRNMDKFRDDISVATFGKEFLKTKEI